MKNSRRHINALFIVLSLLAPSLVAAQQGAFELPPAARLTGSVLVTGRSMQYLETLTDRFGNRLSGSPGYERSAEWAAAEFRAMGIADVKLEPFTIDNGWLRGDARGRILAPVERTLHVASLGWSPSTPAGGVRGDIIVVGDVSPQSLKSRAKEFKGRIVMLDVQSIFARGVWSAFGQLMAKGWKVEGRDDVLAAMKPISEALLKNLGGELSPELTFDTDHGHFVLEGIPALDLWVDMEPYNKVHHKSSDTLDKVDAHNLAAGSAIVAVTAYTIAERTERLAPRIDRKAVGELLKKAQLDEFLKAVGVWK